MWVYISDTYRVLSFLFVFNKVFGPRTSMTCISEANNLSVQHLHRASPQSEPLGNAPALQAPVGCANTSSLDHSWSWAPASLGAA